MTSLALLPAGLRRRLQRWWPEPLVIGRREQLAVAAAALFAIALTGLLTALTLGPAPLLVASMGAAAVLLYTLPSSPLAQPWPLLGGHLVSAAIGVACALGYLDLRQPEFGWRERQPGLAAWYAEVSQRPSLRATAPAA